MTRQPFTDITSRTQYLPARATAYLHRQIALARRSYMRINFWRRSNSRRAVFFRRDYPRARFRLNENNFPEVFMEDGWVPLRQAEYIYP